MRRQRTVKSIAGDPLVDADARRRMQSVGRIQKASVHTMHETLRVNSTRAPLRGERLATRMGINQMPIDFEPRNLFPDLPPPVRAIHAGTLENARVFLSRHPQTGTYVDRSLDLSENSWSDVPLQRDIFTPLESTVLNSAAYKSKGCKLFV